MSDTESRMFTGIIQAVGKVASRKGARLELEAPARGLKAGESVAVNGVCLTVVPPLAPKRLRFDVSEETFRLTNLAALRPGDRVNLEPALKAGDPLGGHLVSGHVDARGKVLALTPQAGGFAILRVELPPALRPFVAKKGSVCVDGVSLTVAALGRDWFTIALVPHTLAHTNLGGRKRGDVVNLEADMIARYVRACLDARR